MADRVDVERPRRVQVDQAAEGGRRLRCRGSSHGLRRQGLLCIVLFLILLLHCHWILGHPDQTHSPKIGFRWTMLEIKFQVNLNQMIGWAESSMWMAHLVTILKLEHNGAHLMVHLNGPNIFHLHSHQSHGFASI